MRTTWIVALAAVTLSLTACAAPEEKSPVSAAAGPSASAAGGSLNLTPEQNRIRPAKDEAAAALLPADVRASGKLTIGVGAAGSGFPPLAFAATDNKTLIGNEPDIAVAIAGTLGLEPVGGEHLLGEPVHRPGQREVPAGRVEHHGHRGA